MRLTVTVPDDVADQARQLATESERSVSSVVAEAIAGHVATERRRRAFGAIDALVGSAAPDPNGAAQFDAELDALRAGSDREL
ncbi:ribbon-helix-helix domain-containing protein [Rubricoccus marinus]|uniref:CopG-like ribbon-helix-helix domain-containing protein n=1 Tax=Rubricoccus marinus TaxID=716817 RepID=A0A259TV19_9BACT|nr:ribbon-helix-helix protein, CopG family [Rubricoccus marinus]OZC01467.1 hypothetical protein BSZ36_17475 [Rubricoccus marinus]